MAGERAVVWHQKLGIALLVTIALATFVLGFVHIKNTIAQTFAPHSTVTFKSDEEIQAERDAKLKATDTDGDGLNDYDELYVFRTSPFLDDSDSDGIKDGEEVAASTDPNCPRGRQCRQSAVAPAPTSGAADAGTATTTGDTATAAPSAPNETKAYEAITKTFGDPSKLTAAQITTTINAMASKDLRAFIATLGVPADALAKADDATLKKMLSDTMIEIAGASASASSPK